MGLSYKLITIVQIIKLGVYLHPSMVTRKYNIHSYKIVVMVSCTTQWHGAECGRKVCN